MDTHASTSASTPPLFHYTRRLETVSKILRNGFLMAPNRRELMEVLLPGASFGEREPQQFGMISFTELDLGASTRHSENFGKFGICVTADWARRNGAHRVLYVDKHGPVTESFRWLFELGHQELQIKHPDYTDRILENDALSALYAQIYSRLTAIYEFMEPAANAHQMEWRIVNPVRQYHDLSNRARLLESLLKDADSGIGTVRVEPDDVAALIIPKKAIRPLQASLPESFRRVPIIPHKPLSKLWTILGRLAIKSRHGPVTRMRAQPAERAQNLQLSPINNRADSYLAPCVHEIIGLEATRDLVRARQRLTVGYATANGQLVDVEMSVAEAAKLYLYLNGALQHPEFSRTLQEVVEKASGQGSERL